MNTWLFEWYVKKIVFCILLKDSEIYGAVGRTLGGNCEKVRKKVLEICYKSVIFAY